MDTWSCDRAARMALAAVLLALAVSPLPSAAQPTDELRRQIRAFDGLAAELGLPPLRSGRAPESGDRGGVRPEVLPLRDAFCRMMNRPRSEGDPAPCAMEGDWEDVLGGQGALQQVFDLADGVYLEALDALAGHVFDTTVCPAGREDICSDPEALRESWRRQNGPKAFLLLDRIGREWLNLSISASELALDDAKQTVLRGFEYVLELSDVQSAARYLAEVDSARFGPLQSPKADRPAVVEAVAEIPAWLQDEMSRRMQARMEGMAEETEGLSRLKEMFAAALAAPAVEDHAPDAAAMDQVRTSFWSLRQGFSQIVASGHSLHGVDECRLPRVSSADSPSLSRDSVERAGQGYEAFVDACEVPPGASFLARVDDALQKAAAPRPTPVETAQALCRRYSSEAAAALPNALSARLSDEVRALLSGCPDLTHAWARGIEARLEEGPDEADADEAVEATVPALPDDDVAQAVTRAVEAAATVLPDDEIDAIRADVSDLRAKLRVAEQLLAVDRLPMPRYGDGGTCDEPNGILAYAARLRDAAVTSNEAGDLRFRSSVAVAFCRPSVDVDVIGFWDFALVPDAVDVALPDPGADFDAEATVRRWLDEVEIDADAVAAMVAYRVESGDPAEAGGAEEDGMRTRTFGEPLRRSFADRAMRGLFDPKRFPEKYDVRVGDASATVRMHPLAADRADDAALCVMVPLVPDALPVEGCSTHLWDVDAGTLEEFGGDSRQVLLEALWPTVAGALGKAAGATVDADDDRWSRVLAGGAVSLEVGPRDAVVKVDVERALADVPPELFTGSRAAPADLSGRLRVSMDLADMGSSTASRVLDHAVLESPKVVLERVVERELADALRGGRLAIAPVAGRQCVDLAFGEGGDAPLTGRLGALCWEDGDLAHAAPPDGTVLDVANGGLRLEVGPTEWRADDDKLVLVAGLTPGIEDDRWGIGRVPIDVELEIDLRSGATALPVEANAPLRDHLRRRAGPFLPVGVTVDGVTLGPGGLGLDVVGAGGDRLEVLLSELHDAARARIGEWAAGLEPSPTGCAEAQVGAIFQMLRTLSPPDDEARWSVVERCAGEGITEIGMEGGLSLGDVEGLTWKCQPAFRGRPGFRRCTVGLPQIGSYCEGVSFEVDIDRRNGAPAARFRNELLAGLCVQQMLAALVQDRLPGIEVGAAPSLRLDCEDPASPASCGFVATARVDLRPLFGNAGAAGSDRDAVELGRGTVELRVRIGFDGSLAFEAGVDELLNLLVDAADDLVDTTLRDLDEVVDAAAPFWNRMEDFLRSLEDTIRGWDGFDCHVRLDGPEARPCSEYLEVDRATDLRKPTAVVFEKELELFGRGFTVRGEFAPDFDQGPRLSAVCGGCEEGLDRVADRVARALADWSGRYVDYEGGASVLVDTGGIRLHLPMVLAVEPLPVEPISFAVECGVELPGGGLECAGKGDPGAVVQQIVSEAVEEAFGDFQPPPFLAGPFVAEFHAPRAENGRIVVGGGFKLGSGPELGTWSLAIPLSGDGPVEPSFDETALTSRVEEVLTEQLDDFLGGLVPLQVNSASIVKSANDWPTGLRIESSGEIAGLFKVSAPAVVLTADGLEVDGPKELRLGLSGGVPIPAPPVTVCIEGGAISEDRLTVDVDIVVDPDCDVEIVPLHVDGAVEVSLRQPGEFGVHGTLVLLDRNLGSVNAELNLSEAYFESVVEIGGELSRIVAFRGRLRVQGDPAAAVDFDAQLRVFGTQLGEAEIKIDLEAELIRAMLNAEVLGFISAKGEFDSGARFSDPHASLSADARVLGWRLAGGRLSARPRRLVATFSLLGFRVGVVLPGLDMLSPQVLVELILRLLTPDLLNLDKALEAILQGNLTMNPFAEFGSGGELAIDGGEDSEDEGDGDADAGEDAGAETPPPTAPPPGPQTAEAASAGSGSALLNPEGRFHVEFQPEGRGHGIDRMEGAVVDGRIAYAPRHELTAAIFDERGAGEPLAFTDATYAHVAKAALAAAGQPAGCPSGAVAPTVFTFTGGSTGRDVGRVGYFELCRLVLEDDPVSQKDLRQLAGDDWGQIVEAFISAVARWPALRPRPGRDREGNPLHSAPERVLSSGWMGRIDNMRLVAGLLAPGYLLVAGDMPPGPATGCMETGGGGSATPGEERRTVARVLHDPRWTVPLTRGDVERIAPLLEVLDGCGADAASVYVAGAAGETDPEAPIHLAAGGHVARENPENGTFELLRLPAADPIDAAPDAPLPGGRAALVAAVLAAVPAADPPRPAPPTANGDPESRLANDGGGDGGASPASPAASEGGEPGDGAGADAPAAASGGAGPRAPVKVLSDLNVDGRRIVFGSVADGGGCAVWYETDRGDATHTRMVTRYDLARFGNTCLPPHGASAFGGSRRVVVFAEQDDGTVIYHFGWDEAQAIPVATEAPRPQSGRSVDPIMPAMVLPRVDHELKMVETYGFDRPGPKGVRFAAPADDSRTYLAWAGAARSGMIEIGIDLTENQIARLPGYLADLDGFDCSARDRRPNAAPPCRMDDLAPVGARGYRLLTPSRYPETGAALPVLAWDEDEERDGDAGWWRVAVWLTERPRLDEDDRPALSSKVAKIIPERQPAKDAWLFDLAVEDGERRVGAAVGGKLVWSVHPVSMLALDESEKEEHLQNLCHVVERVRPIGRSERGLVLRGFAAWFQYREFATQFLPALREKYDSRPESSRPDRFQDAEDISLLLSYLSTLGRKVRDGEWMPPCDVAAEDHERIAGLIRVFRPGTDLTFSPPVTLPGFSDLKAHETCDPVAAALIERLEDMDGDAGKEQRLRVEGNGCDEVYLLTAEPDSETLRAIDIWRGGDFHEHSRFEGDGLPEVYLARFMARFGGWLGDEEGDRTFVGVSTHLSDLFEHPAWTARHPETGDLHIFLRHAGDQGEIEIEVDETDLVLQRLDGLVRFALASGGDSFEVVARAGGERLAVRVETATGAWVVNLDGDLQPQAWLALDRAAVAAAREEVPVRQLAEVLDMAHGLAPEEFAYPDHPNEVARGPGLPFPMAWRGEGRLAVRPFDAGPYLLSIAERAAPGEHAAVEGASEARTWAMGVCASPEAAAGDRLLDLAVRLGREPSVWTDVSADLARGYQNVMTVSGDGGERTCNGVQPGTMHFAESRQRPEDVGVLYQLDEDRRLGVAVVVPCDGSGRGCDVDMARTDSPVTGRLAEGLAEKLAAGVHTVDGDAPAVRPFLDDVDDRDGDGVDGLLYGWKPAASGTGGTVNLEFVYGRQEVDESSRGTAPTCVLDPLPLVVPRGRDTEGWDAKLAALLARYLKMEVGEHGCYRVMTETLSLQLVGEPGDESFLKLVLEPR